MIDLHSHILTIDDGAESIGEAIVMLKIAEEQGVRKMVATPHYVKNGDNNKGYFFRPDEIAEHVVNLRSIIKEENINIDLLTGSEVYYHDRLGKDIDDGLITMINGSRYFLLELPSNKIPTHLINILYDLYHLGVKPIIAHPERNMEIMKNPNSLHDLIKKDWAYAQVNSSSLLGVYGKRVQKTAEILVKKNLVQLIGSDCHSIGKRKPSLKEGIDIIEKINGNSAYFINNNQMIIENKKLVLKKPKKIKNRIIFKLKTEIAFA